VACYGDGTGLHPLRARTFAVVCACRVLALTQLGRLTGVCVFSFFMFCVVCQHFLSASSFEELDRDAQSKKMSYVFRKYDNTNSGFITQEQLGLLAKELGVELTAAELREACVGLDTNRNGLIEFDELVTFWTG